MRVTVVMLEVYDMESRRFVNFYYRFCTPSLWAMVPRWKQKRWKRQARLRY